MTLAPIEAARTAPLKESLLISVVQGELKGLLLPPAGQDGQDTVGHLHHAAGENHVEGVWLHL